MKDSLRIMLSTAKIQNRISSNSKKPRAFGTTQLLYQSEIHFIDAIEPGEGINASELSQKMGITNGAVTQLADKLIKKKLLVRYKMEGNKKEVYLKLTPEGEIAFTRHRLFHKKLNDKMTAYLDSLSPEQTKVIFDMLDVIEQYLPDLSKEE